MCFTDKNSSHARRQDGLTLIELMFAVFIVAISVLALYEMIIQGAGMLEEQRHRRLALEKAQGQMELMKYWAAQTDTIPLGMGRSFMDWIVPDDPESDRTAIPAECTITITHAIQHYVENNLPIYSEVSIEYTWDEVWSGQHESIVLKGRF